MTDVSIVDDLGDVERRLAPWFAARLDAPVRAVSLRRLPGGYSNPTFVAEVARASGETHPYVLRWDPITGPQAPYDMRGQFLTFRGLAPTEVPTPRCFWFEPDLSVLGRVFWVGEFVHGESPGRLLDLAEPRTPGRMAAFVATLAAIHRVDWRSRGLGQHLPILRPDDLAAMIDAETWLFANLRGEADLALFEQARAWLHARAPQRFPLRLNHGDCNLSNYLFDGEAVIAVLDWELASITDPMSDIGFYCALIFRYRGATPEADKQREKDAFLAAYAAASPAPSETLGFWEAFANYRYALSWTQQGLERPDNGFEGYKTRMRKLIGL